MGNSSVNGDVDYDAVMQVCRHQVSARAWHLMGNCTKCGDDGSRMTRVSSLFMECVGYGADTSVVSRNITY